MVAELATREVLNERIEAAAVELQSPAALALLGLENRECPVTHSFAPGVYIRTITMPGENTLVIGAEHKTEHFNIVHRGRARVMMDGVMHEIVAPAMFVSGPGVRKVLVVEEEMEWSTVHVNPTNTHDLDALAEMCVVMTPSFEFAEAARKDAAAMKLDLEQPNLEVGGAL